MERIAYIKTGWCDYYDGDEVVGAHDFIKRHGFGHEAFNMRPYQKRFYIYIPPIGNTFAAPSQSDGFDDWFIVLVAPKNGTGPLVVVGWYTKAQFIGAYKNRPDSVVSSIAADPMGNEYSYTIVAKDAYLIPPEMREISLPVSVMRRTPVYYARGGSGKDSPSREVMAKFAERLIASNQSLKIAGKVEVSGSAIGGGYASKKHRDKVERESMAFATEHFLGKGYKVKDVSREKNRGYDLLVTKSKEELLVEVKGTAAKAEEFFITANEDAAAERPAWRLAVVTLALYKPIMQIYLGSEYLSRFSKKPVQFKCKKR